MTTPNDAKLDLERLKKERSIHQRLWDLVRQQRMELHDAELKQAREQRDKVAAFAKELVNGMSTCHSCGASVLVPDDIVHCVDCPSGCECHDAPDCLPVSELHERLQSTLAALEKEKQP